MRTAREAFLKGPHRSDFEKIAGTNAFDVACEYALLAMLEELPDCAGNPNENWAMHSETIGAQKVIKLLRSLHLQPEEPKSVPFPNLKAPR